MKKETNNRKNKLNIAKILSLVCLGLLMFGFFIGANNPEESTIISNIKHRKVLVGDTFGGCSWNISSDGTLVIKATGTNGGFLGDITDTVSAPWYNYRLQIKKAIVGESGNPVKVNTGCRIGGMFRDCSNLTNVNFVNFDTTNSTTLWYMFYNCKSLRTITGFEKIKATKATSTKFMFYNCSELQSLNIGPNFNSTKVTDMCGMFQGCTKLSEIQNFNNLNTTKVTDMSYMFSNTASLNNLTFGTNFKTNNVTDMHNMFNNGRGFTTLDLSTFDTTHVTDFSKMFIGTNIRTLNINGNNFVSTSATNMMQMFPGSTLKEISIGNFDFKMNHLDYQPYPWGRGSWEKGTWNNENWEAEGIYSAVERAVSSTNTDISGTYRKVSNVSNLFHIDETITFSIDKYVDVDLMTSTVTGNKDIGMYKNITKSEVYIYANIPLTNNVYQFDSGDSITVKIPGAATDANNNRYDLEVKLTNLYIKGLHTIIDDASGNTVTKASVVPLRFLPDTIIAYSNICKEKSYENTIVSWSKFANQDVSFDTQIRILDPNDNNNPAVGNFMFSAYDIDVPDRIGENSTYTDSYTSSFSEGINLISGFNTSQIYTATTEIGSWIYRENLANNVVRLRAMNFDNSSEMSEFMVSASASGAKFKWTAGLNCGTSMLSTYQPKLIKIRKVENIDSVLTDINGADLQLLGYGYEDPSWTSDGTEKAFFLNPGQYTLKELSPPEGYRQTEDIIFWVDSDNNLTSSNPNAVQNNDTIVMTDQRLKTVKIKKVDDTGADISEAYLSLTGNGVNEYWYSDSTEKEVLLNPGQYVLHEVHQPTSGYELAEDITFEVDSDNNLTSSNPNAVQNNDTIIMTDQRKELNYTIEYYYDNVKDDSKTETGSSLYQSIIDSYPDKNITGYKFVKHENFPLTISENSRNNVIKVYYEKDTFDYRIDYYYDNVKDDSKTESGSALYQSTINSYPDKNIIGYKFDKHENVPLTISANPADNVIKVYYIKDNFNYTVEYYYDNVKDNSKTETGSALYQSTIDSYPDKNITGYKWDKHENVPLTISANPADNVIKVYYIKDNFNYTVEYYYDNVKDNSKTETGLALYQSTIDSYTDKNITGYKFDKHENVPLTISANPADNVIKVYYIKDNFNYTVEYYYDNVKDNSKTETGSALYQSTIDSYPDKNITGYKFDKHENVPLTITENPDNNVIKVYYIIDNGNTKTLSYTVEYYKDNVKVNSDTETRSVTVQVLEPDTLELDRSLINNNNKYVGYKLERTNPTNVPDLVNNGTIIKVYYVKENFNYTIEYYYDNAKDNSKTETGSALYQSTIDNYTDKNITGYKFDKTENLPLTITENADNNVIKVYYVKDNFNYTVEYYYDNVKDASKTETGSALYQSTIDSYPDKNITGYKFDKHENVPLTITENPDNNVIKVYYIIDNGNTKTLSYTVEYYKDNVKVNSDTETRSVTVQVLEPDTLELDRSLINNNNKYVGYKLERTNPTNVPDLVNNGTIIKVYYVKENFNYTIEYYYDNAKDNSKTETGSALYQSTIDSYTDKNITGYKFDKTENLPLTITENADNNVIKVYYVKDNFNYTVEYYYDNVKDASKTETGSALYQSIVDSYPDKNITGYKWDKHENVPLTISANSADNVIKVYYVKDNFNYTIEYYYDNVKDDSKTDTGSALYQSTIDNYIDKNITGYKFDKTENLPLTITENSNNNVIKVYYVKDNFNYTVEYYYDNVKDASKTETGSALYQSTINSYPDKNITGYKFDKHENVPLTISANSTDNVIKVYYVKDNFNYTIEYYYDNIKDNNKTETGSALYQSIVDSYPDKNIIGYKWDKHENVPLTISANSADNVIKVYYVKDNFNYTVEYYYDNVKDDSKTETGSALYQSTIDSYPDKNITGYRWDKHENVPLTISENPDNNVIKVYYIIDNGNTKTLSYTVEYYKDNVKVEGDTETRTKTVQILEPDTLDLDRSLINDNNKYVGYKLEKTIPANVPDVVNDGDVIKVYYIKDTFGYRVEYYYDNVKDDSKTETGSALYQSTIDNYIDKNITGYKFDKTENLPLTITENSDNNVIKVYYVKDNFNYTVEYYYDNIKDNNKTETGSALYQSIVDSYPDKNIIGYKWDKHENVPLTISANSADNVIKVYYVKDNFNYTIEYYYDNIKDNNKTETGSALYQSTIDSYTDKNITGYKFDKTENLPLTITENADNNVIKVYYVKDSFNYTIEYYYENVKDDTKTETGSALYQSTIDSYPDKNITGYRWDKHENVPLTISENPDNNVIKVYYIIDNGNTKTLSYTVEYYKDNVKVEGDTETRTKTVQILEPDTLELDRSLINNNNKYVGYKLEKTIPANVPDVVNDGDVIKVYYIKDTFGYRVEYYYDNVKDDSKTETGSALYQSTIDSYTDKNITGYKFDKTENLPLTITENSDNNVIKVYYVKDNFNYTIEYYYDNAKDNSKTETGSALYQSTIDSYPDKNIIGYKFDKHENVPLTISANPADNVIKVYYIKDNFNYTVEYYYDNVKDTSKTENGSALYQSTIDNYLDKNITGYKFDKTENLPLTITENADNNVIKVYYVKDSFNYTIEYYYENVKDDTKTETGSALYQSTINSYPDKNIIGYKWDKHENVPLTITENADNNVIKVYYVKDNFNYTIEYYYDNVKDDDKTETGSALYQSTINNYTDKNITGYKFDKTENLPLTITENADNNVIKVYYVKDNFNYTIEYYYDNVKDDSKTETGSALYQSTIDSYTDKNITGYKFDKTENLPLTITENADNNVIKVYYVKDNFNYTIEYYYDNVKDDGKTETGSALYQSTIDSYPDKNIIGYKWDKHENVPLTISANSADNVIKVYYIKDNFNYTVEYYYDNVKDDSKTETGSALYQSTIDSYTDKNITGYKFDKTENLPLTITENLDNNVIKVYYVKDNFNYTIEYYYDNVKDDNKTETGSALYQSIVDSYPDKNITGYKWDKHENVPLTITENADNNVIKVYYVKDNFNYTIEYYYDNVKDDDKTETGSALYQSAINNYIDKNITGYKFDKHENVPLTITENADNNVIKVYYVKASFEYSVEYYYDNERDDSKTETRLAEYQSSIEDYTDKNIVGYKFEKHENVPLTITENVANNVIKVYYVKDSFNYTTEYYYNDVKDDTKTESRSAEYQSIIENYTDKKLDGYEFDKTENLPLTISENPLNNIIKVYYYPIRTLTVNHIDMNTNEILETSKEEGREGKAITTSALDFTGYMLVKKPEVENYTLKPEAQIVNYYYAKISSGVVEKHINIVTDKYIADDVSYEGYVGKDYLTSNKDFADYDLVTNEKYYRIMAQKDESLLSNNGVTTVEELIEKLQVNAEETYIPENYKGKMTEEPIEVKYYYVKKAKVNVHYLDKNSKKPVHPEDTITGHEKDSYATTPIEIEGYDLVTETNYYPTNLEGEMGEEPIEIIFYYERKAEVEVNHICITDDSKIHSYKIEGHEKDSYKTQILNKDEYKNYKIITNKEYYEYATKKDKSILTKNNVTSVEALLEKLGLTETNPYIPENNSGEMTTEKIVVNYYYKKIGTIVVKYIDEETGEIIISTLDALNYGETYSSRPIDILDYIIDEEKMPTNYTGIVEKDSEEIIYYYKKVKQDNTVAPGKIPQTGENGIKIALSLLGIASIVIISKRKIQKYKFSK